MDIKVGFDERLTTSMFSIFGENKITIVLIRIREGKKGKRGGDKKDTSSLFQMLR